MQRWRQGGRKGGREGGRQGGREGGRMCVCVGGAASWCSGSIGGAVTLPRRRRHPHPPTHPHTHTHATSHLRCKRLLQRAAWSAAAAGTAARRARSAAAAQAAVIVQPQHVRLAAALLPPTGPACCCCCCRHRAVCTVCLPSKHILAQQRCRLCIADGALQLKLDKRQHLKREEAAHKGRAARGAHIALRVEQPVGGLAAVAHRQQLVRVREGARAQQQGGQLHLRRNSGRQRQRLYFWRGGRTVSHSGTRDTVPRHTHGTRVSITQAKQPHVALLPPCPPAGACLQSARA
jgi:hypothetical protein